MAPDLHASARSDRLNSSDLAKNFDLHLGASRIA
jgi:hypothetical protein